MERLLGNRAIGHTRYATTGGAGLRNVQPFFAELADGGLAIAHNGNLTNAMTVQRALQKDGAIFSSTSDTETILHLIATSRERDLNSRFIAAHAPGRRRLLAGRAVVEEDDRHARPARHPAAGARRSRRRLDPGVRNLRPRHHRRALRARPEAGRDGGGDRQGHRKQFPVRAAEIALLHFRIRLFRAAGFCRSKDATSTM